MSEIPFGKIEEVVANLYKPGADAGDLMSTGGVLVMIASALKGETIIESRDALRFQVPLLEQLIMTHWDQLRSMPMPSGEPPTFVRPAQKALDLGGKIAEMLQTVERPVRDAALAEAISQSLLLFKGPTPETTRTIRREVTTMFFRMVRDLIELGEAKEEEQAKAVSA